MSAGPDLVGEQKAGPPPQHLVQQLFPVADPPVQRGAGHADAAGQRPHVQPLAGHEGVHGRREDRARNGGGRPGPLG